MHTGADHAITVRVRWRKLRGVGARSTVRVATNMGGAIVATAPEQAEALRELADRLDPKVRQKPLADMPDTDASAAATELREVAALLDRIWAGGNPEAAEANAP